MLRVLCDTNVIISGMFSSGIPNQIYQAGTRQGKFLFLRAQPLIDELRRVMQYPYFAERIQRAELEIDGLLYDFVNASLPATLATIPPDIIRDPKDLHLLAAAVGGQADYLVSGDKDLLVLASYAGIPIVTPAQFLERLNAAGK